jgi:hypothetical protein
VRTAGTSENRDNTEFATILEMGLREAYPHRALAVLAHGALEDTHTEHPTALGPKRRWAFRRTGWWRGTQGPRSRAAAGHGGFWRERLTGAHASTMPFCPPFFLFLLIWFFFFFFFFSFFFFLFFFFFSFFLPLFMRLLRACFISPFLVFSLLGFGGSDTASGAHSSPTQVRGGCTRLAVKTSGPRWSRWTGARRWLGFAGEQSQRGESHDPAPGFAAARPLGGSYGAAAAWSAGANLIGGTNARPRELTRGRRRRTSTWPS